MSCIIIKMLTDHTFQIYIGLQYSVENDRKKKKKDRRYRSTVCTSAHYDMIGLPVFRVFFPSSKSVLMLCEL